MGTINDRNDHSLVELANRMKGKALADVLLKLAENEILGDMRFKPANGGLKHQESTFENLPVAEFGPLGGFWPTVKADARQVEEDCAKAGAYSTVAVDVAKASGNPARYRHDEDLAIVEGISQQLAEMFFYGDRRTNPLEPLGLANRLNTVAMANVLDAGGDDGDDGLTSIYVLKHDPRSFFGIYRQGSQSGGVSVRDLGEDTETDKSTGKKRQVFQTFFEAEMGFMIRDPRVVYRIANVPIHNDPENTAGMARTVAHLVKILNTIPGRNSSGLRIYCNADFMTALDLYNLGKANASYGPTEVDGKMVQGFRQVPVRRCDALMNTEEKVV